MKIFAYFRSGALKTESGNSPAVIAKNFSVTYGVRTDAIEAILRVYEAEGHDVEGRKKFTEQILQEYAKSPEKKQKADELSENTRRKMGIADTSEVADALEWDLFAPKYYLSTTGYNSPAVVAKGNVNIWYGIPPKTLRALAVQLEKNKTEITSFETKLAEQVKKYEELRTELKTYGAQEAIYQQAEFLLEAGKLEEAEQLIESDFDTSMKRQAYKGFVLGKTKELLLKYQEAAKGYKNAINNDEGSSIYHLFYAHNENTLAHYDEAIKHYEIALRIDLLKSEEQEGVSNLLHFLGISWLEKGNYEKSIEYFNQSLQIRLQVLGVNNINVADSYDGLGGAWHLKHEYNKAIEYYKKSLQIRLQVLGSNHPSVATSYNNIGGIWHSNGEYDEAIKYFENALQIDLQVLDDKHPEVATVYNNLGGAWYSKNEYDKSIGFYEKALQVNLQVLGEHHPHVALNYYNIGCSWSAKGKYDQAIVNYEKSLPTSLNALGYHHPTVAMIYISLGAAWDFKESHEKAIEYYTKGIEILDNTDPNKKTYALRLSNLANDKGLVLFSEKKYQESIEYFKIAIKNACEARDDYTMINGLFNLGISQKYLKKYSEALQSLEDGFKVAVPAIMAIGQTIDQNDPENLGNGQAISNVFELRTIINQMMCHKIGCLKALNRKDEANTLAEQLWWHEGIQYNDTHLLDTLRKEGYDFKKN
jgi:tetratricopeptide (TPR) repeat protein